MHLTRIRRIWDRNHISFTIKCYPNEAIHDDCVVAFTGGYEKITTENQTKRVNVDNGIRHKKINYNLDNNLFILLLTDCNMIKYN